MLLLLVGCSRTATSADASADAASSDAAPIGPALPPLPTGDRYPPRDAASGGIPVRIRMDPDATRLTALFGHAERTVVLADARATEAALDDVSRSQPYRKSLCTPEQKAKHGCGDRPLAITLEAPASTPLAKVRALFDDTAQIAIAYLVGTSVARVPILLVKERAPIVLPATSTVQALVDAVLGQEAGVPRVQITAERPGTP